MERSYLKSWKDFFKLTENVEQKLKELITNAKPTDLRYVDSNLVALRALSACKFSSKNLRE